MNISEDLINAIKEGEEKILSDHSLLPHKRPFKEIKEVYFNSNQIICFIEVEYEPAPIWIFRYDYPKNFFSSNVLKEMDEIEQLIFDHEELFLKSISDDAYDICSVRFSDDKINIAYFDADYATISDSLSYKEFQTISNIAKDISDLKKTIDI